MPNAQTAAARRRPAGLAAWPPHDLRALWAEGQPDEVIAWALGVPGGPATPDAADLTGALATWSRAAAGAQRGLARALAAHDYAQLASLAISEQLGPLPPDADTAEREAAAAVSAAQRRAYCRIAPDISVERLDAALAELWRAARQLEDAAAGLPAEAWPQQQVRRLRTREGFVVLIGTPGDDSVPPGWHLWLDPGGDDEVAADLPATPPRIQTSIDLAGEDHYFAAESGIGGTIGGLSVLIDVAGNDSYDGGRWSCGAAAFGGAILLDRAGDDAYAGRSAALGAAFHGTAVLLDVHGQDVYSVGAQGQGFGGPGGVGLLVDQDGHDTYQAGGLVPDTNRDRANSLSMAQGCGFGLRPDVEGGTGMLLDTAGDDRYTVEVFGQGVGYWGGAGFLWDRAGDDTYRGVQYVQGTGLHFGVGVLSDGAGADTYTAGGLAQGCGHDIGIGVCLDAGGSDRYAVGGLGGGASSGGGLGIFWDGAGDDRYLLSPISNLGCDASPATRPGFAVHVDAGGQDRFLRAGLRSGTSAPARNNATWFNGRAGVAVNYDAGALPAATTPAHPPP